MNIQFKFNKRNRITESIDHASLKQEIYCFLFCGKYQYLYETFRDFFIVLLTFNKAVLETDC